MHFLQPALFAEGPTDHRFLKPLLDRLCVDLCLRSRATVETADVIELQPATAHRHLPRAACIAKTALSAKSSWNLLFIHADADGDEQAARAQRVWPGIDELHRLLNSARHPAVAIVPVRTTEAWALADGKALRHAYGVTLDDRQLRIPTNPRDVEQLPDPKSALLASFLATSPSRKKARGGVAPYLGLMGGNVSIAVLRRVPAFAQLETDLLAALVSLRMIET